MKKENQMKKTYFGLEIPMLLVLSAFVILATYFVYYLQSESIQLL